jgi:hypothetical protein
MSWDGAPVVTGKTKQKVSPALSLTITPSVVEDSGDQATACTCAVNCPSDVGNASSPLPVAAPPLSRVPPT